MSSYGSHRAVPVGEVSLSCRMKESLVKKIGSFNANLSPREAILCDYKHIFEGLGCMPQEYHIEIEQDATPVAHPKYLLSSTFVWTLVT